MSGMEALVQYRPDILRLAAEHGARNIRVFGSFARGEATESSDLDLIVDFDENRSLLDVIGLKLDLKDLLRREVDVLTEDSIYWLLKRKILREARPL